jgi:synaptojanin
MLRASVPPSFISVVPEPSSDEAAWWDTPGKRVLNPETCTCIEEGFSIDHPNGVVPVPEVSGRTRSANPFDSPAESPLSSSPSSSEEEIYATLQTPMVPAPVPDGGGTFTPNARKPPPPVPSRGNKPTAL